MSNAKSVRPIPLSLRLFAPNNALPWPPIDAFSAPLLCQFRPLQHSNYTSEYTHRMRRVRQARWPHKRRGTVENWCRIQQREWLAPPRRGREKSLGCVRGAWRRRAWKTITVQVRREAKQSQSRQLGMNSPPPKGKERSLAVANRATYFPRFSLTPSSLSFVLASFLLYLPFPALFHRAAWRIPCRP